MKYTVYTIGILLTAGMLFSCEKEEKYDYAGGNQIYFATTEDSSYYSFAVQNSAVNEDVAYIPVAISGLAADVDREIGIEVLKEGTTAKEGADRASGAHYHLGKTILKKGELQTNIPVTVFRQADLYENKVYVILKIVPSGTFLGGMGEEVLIHRFQINDILTKPINWDTYLRRYFGDYGPVKYRFIIDKLGRYEFESTGEDPVTEAELAYYRDVLRTKLQQEGPLYEAGGVLVTF